jgi:hypothetical protein
MAKRTLHPKMALHAQKVVRAHQQLSQAMPGFAMMKPADRFKHIQKHIRKAK